MVRVLTEDETLDIALAGKSLTRFGDGEMRIAAGSGCSSQAGSPKLAAEFQEILAGKAGPALPCIPRMFEGMGNADGWHRYLHDPKYTAHYRMKEPYGSAFITRPDNAPHIDNPEYWERATRLWKGKGVVLVRGDEKSLTSDMLLSTGATAVDEVIGPRTQAYEVIDKLEAEIGLPGKPILLCLGACATALAARLARKGEYALDLGHLGMFMRHAGIYSVPVGNLLSKGYRQTLQKYHQNNKWGTGGWKLAGEVITFKEELGAKSILDYGCGQGTLARALSPIRVMEYDPGIPGKDKLPRPVDLVCCCDVLEHVEYSHLDGVLKHLLLLAGKGVFLSIAQFPAEKFFPDGRDLHLILRDTDWWLKKLREHNYPIARHDQRGRTLYVWVKK